VLVAQRLLDVMRKPFVLEDRTDDPLSVTASIGMATAGPESSSGELLRSADIALYRAKAAGRNRSAVYTPDMASDDQMTAP
jgi:diguanylate cyclase (GGDEF)-like protein